MSLSASPVHSLPPGEGFLDSAAGLLLRAAAADLPDLSRHLVLVSSLPLAAELRTALASAAGRPLLLPQFDTLRRWANAAPLPDIPSPLPESERLVLLHTALAARGWFDETALWGIAAELATLSDELSAAAVRLPDDEAALCRQLEQAYALRASAPLNFEARVVHEMWRALAASGRPDAPSVYRLRLARLAATAARPLFLLLDGPPEERLTPAEQAFLERYAAQQPVQLCAPAPRSMAITPIAAVLAAAWPELPAAAGELPPLLERAHRLADTQHATPFAERLQLVAVSGREQEAEAAAAQVFAWLGDGLRRIALVAEDRLSARRLRALLERQGVLAADETGWKLSTTRAAATVDALLETAAGGAYHLDLLDLCKSPHLFAEEPAAARAAAVLLLEQAIRAAGARSGLAAFREALAAYRNLDADGGPVRALAASLLDRLEVALRILGGKPVALPRWLDRLSRALQAVGADASLAADAAGGELLDLLAQRQAELAGSEASFAFAAWRDWLNRELEGGAFRDRSIASSIVMLPRHDVRLRRFEAALVIGADAEQLAAATGGTFFNQAVRRDLGLPTREDAERALRRDLELLLATVPRVVVTWQREQAGEARLLAPEFDLLSTLHRLAWGDDLKRPPLSLPATPAPEAGTSPVLPRRAAPVVPAAQVPARVSVSGLASLVACPYQFFARHVLRLNELDEVSEELEKSDYGQLVHRSLERFHQAHPSLAGLDDAAALAALGVAVEETFAAAEADNWLALGWRLRWQQRLPAYLAWQREREAAGWRWQAAEVRVARSLPLADGAAVELYGRIDRIDAGADGASLLDYKTKKLGELKKLLADDIQLPAYALLHDGAAEAAYVALDDERLDLVRCAGDLAQAAAAQGRRLVAAVGAMRAGTPLPAHGSERACAWCEARGLCRRDHVADD
ncbi:MAG: PD-(D/E)XK nuclease family protein [Rhodocyclales bacterium]|nr:PD-(D/E)XK nuclease family protein [Rhodocyclales bacterium]